MRYLVFLPLLATATCGLKSPRPVNDLISATELSRTSFREGSWQHFLQNLPLAEGKIKEYSGALASDQQKHVAIVNYDVGTKDLQQCADALMRLRAEYLFKQKRAGEIAFHFTSGDLYRFIDYCRGLRPQIRGNSVRFIQGDSCRTSHASLRKYLDIVYTYAGTISLAKELKPASQFTVGSVIIKPGSPGHCSLIVDEAVNEKGEKFYQLAEGYTPAQSIYILKNPVDGTPWHKLKPAEPIETASYYFGIYKIGVFE